MRDEKTTDDMPDLTDPYPMREGAGKWRYTDRDRSSVTEGLADEV